MLYLFDWKDWKRSSTQMAFKWNCRSRLNNNYSSSGANSVKKCSGFCDSEIRMKPDTHVVSVPDYTFHPCLLLKILLSQASSCVSAWWTPGGSSGLVVSWLSLNVFRFLSMTLSLMKSAELFRIVQFADWILMNSIYPCPCQLCYICAWLYYIISPKGISRNLDMYL